MVFITAEKPGTHVANDTFIHIFFGNFLVWHTYKGIVPIRTIIISVLEQNILERYGNKFYPQEKLFWEKPRIKHAPRALNNINITLAIAMAYVQNVLLRVIQGT